MRGHRASVDLQPAVMEEEADGTGDGRWLWGRATLVVGEGHFKGKSLICHDFWCKYEYMHIYIYHTTYNMILSILSITDVDVPHNKLEKGFQPGTRRTNRFSLKYMFRSSSRMPVT